MAERFRGRAAIKLGFWTALAVGLFVLAATWHTSGKFAGWYYYRASEDGYAVDADRFLDATRKSPSVLRIGRFSKLRGLEATPVKKGDRLPAGANGVIAQKVIAEGRRAAADRSTLRVYVPAEVDESRGFHFKDTFKHKGVETDPRAALYNLLLVFALGISLGFMAEGFTDLLGIRVRRIRHSEAPESAADQRGERR